MIFVSYLWEVKILFSPLLHPYSYFVKGRTVLHKDTCTHTHTTLQQKRRVWDYITAPHLRHTHYPNLGCCNWKSVSRLRIENVEKMSNKMKMSVEEADFSAPDFSPFSCKEAVLLFQTEIETWWRRAINGKELFTDSVRTWKIRLRTKKFFCCSLQW